PGPARVVVRGVAYEVHDLRAWASAPLRRRRRRRWGLAVVRQRAPRRGAGTGALAREVEHRAARRGVVVRVGDVRRAVRRVDRDLEEVEEGAVSRGCAEVAAEAVDADRARVNDVVAR